jgi:hypothetical protein
VLPVAQRDKDLGHTLASMPEEFKQSLKEKRLQLEQKEREAKKRARFDVQVSRLIACIYFKYCQEHPAPQGVSPELREDYASECRKESEKLAAEFLEFHAPKTGDELQQLISEYYPTGLAEKDQKPLVIALETKTKGNIVAVEGTEEWDLLLGKKPLHTTELLQKAFDLQNQAKKNNNHVSK